MLMNKATIAIRELRGSDDLRSLTELLHRAYRPLLEMGLNYTATNQDCETTKRRTLEGICFVAECGSRIVATVTLSFEPAEWINDYYRRPGVWRFGQFAVEPEWQGKGIGGLMLDHIETYAAKSGAAELALDTAIPAKHLIDFYEKRNYRIVDRCQWPGHTYESVVMSKRLVTSMGKKRV